MSQNNPRRARFLVLIKKKPHLTDEEARQTIDAFAAEFNTLPVVQRNLLKLEVEYVNNKFDRFSIKTHSATAAPEFCAVWIMEAENEAKMHEVVADASLAERLAVLRNSIEEKAEQLFHTDVRTYINE